MKDLNTIYILVKSKMKPKILIMGEEQDYCEAEVSKSRAYLKKEGISELEGLFNDLRIKGTKIVANKLRGYGVSFPLKVTTTPREMIPDALERFFKEVLKYAEKHNAPYVLVQNLNIKRHSVSDIEGLA